MPAVWQHCLCRTWQTSRTKRILETITISDMMKQQRNILQYCSRRNHAASQSFQLIDTVIHINDRSVKIQIEWSVEVRNAWHFILTSYSLFFGRALNIYSLSFSLQCSTEVWIQQHIFGGDMKKNIIWKHRGLRREKRVAHLTIHSYAETITTRLYRTGQHLIWNVWILQKSHCKSFS